MPPDVHGSHGQELAKQGTPLRTSKAALKVVAGLALVGAAAWGGLKLLAPSAPVAPTAEVAPAPKPLPRLTPRPTRAPVTGDSLKAEDAAIEKARQLLASDPFQALRLLEQHRHQFPRSQMAAEREALAIDALGQLGRIGDQKRRAAAFLKHYATSPYVDHVKQALEKR